MAISRKIEKFEDDLPNFSKIKNGEYHLYIPVSSFHDDIIELAKHIESLGSFWFSIRKINWEEPEIIFIPENEEEKRIIEKRGVNNFKSFQKYRPSLIEMNPRVLKEVIENQEMYEHLVIPLSFYREGRNEYIQKRYINAFYNFYFFLEDLYGNGKTKNKQIREEFLKSRHLTYAVKQTIREFKEGPRKNHIENLKKFLKLENCSLDLEGVIFLIVKVRGNLHHFSQKSSKKMGHPFNQKDFETMAFLLMSLCLKSFCFLTTGEKPQ